MFVWSLRLFPAQRENKVLRGGSPDVAPSVFFIGSDVGDRAWTQSGFAVEDGDLKRTGLDHDHLFVHVVMRRMRRSAGSEFRHVKFDRNAGVIDPVEDRTGVVSAIGAHREVFKTIRLGWQRSVFCLGSGGRCEGGKEEAQISARIAHETSVHPADAKPLDLL